MVKKLKNISQYNAISQRLIPRYKYASLKLIDKEKLSQTLYLMRFKVLENIGKPFPPQFIMLWVPGYEAIPMSVALFDEDNNALSIVVKPVGPTTNYLVSLEPGIFMGMYGFLGKPCIPHGKKYLLIGGGSGIAPIMHYTQYISSHDASAVIDILYGCWKYEEIGKIPLILQNYCSSIKTACFSEHCDYHGTLIDALIKIDLKLYDIIIIAGPPGLLENALKILKMDEDVLARVFLVVESMVKCGVGFCGECIVKGTNKLLCVDGPCFPAKELLYVI